MTRGEAAIIIITASVFVVFVYSNYLSDAKYAGVLTRALGG